MPLNTQKIMLAFSIGFVAIMLTLKSAYANPENCAERGKLLNKLNERYGESLQTTGLTPNGHLIETYAHPGTGTWTIILTLPNGISCMLASGKAYEYVNAPAGQGV